MLVKKSCAELKFFKCRSKVTVKVTCSKRIVPSERVCHKEHLPNMKTKYQMVGKLSVENFQIYVKGHGQG